jgi:hypothetical protein
MYWLCDLIELCVTEEIKNDINRSNDETQRNQGRELVNQLIRHHRIIVTSRA